MGEGREWIKRYKLKKKKTCIFPFMLYNVITGEISHHIQKFHPYLKGRDLCKGKGH